MTAQELAERCAEQLRNGYREMLLVLPRPASNSSRMVVFKKPRIMGEVCCENADGNAVVCVDTMEALAMLSAAGLVDVEAAP